MLHVNINFLMPHSKIIYNSLSYEKACSCLTFALYPSDFVIIFKTKSASWCMLVHESFAKSESTSTLPIPKFYFENSET